MKYLDKKFTVGTSTKPYREGYDKIDWKKDSNSGSSGR